MRVNAYPSQPDAAEYMVSIHDLTKRYTEGGETRSVLRGVNADVREGEFIALAGPSGSGKTTLLNLISGIDTPTGGDVLIDSVPITRLSGEGAHAVSAQEHRLRVPVLQSDSHSQHR